MSDQCRECGSTDLENDEQQGQVVCTGCGAVIKDYILLAQQQFQETAGGITAVGQHVGEGGPRGRGYSRESRVVTLEKGKKRIERMAAQLNIKSHITNEAFNYFRLSVNRHLTQGRNSEHFAAACLYIACRINASSEMGVMLLDFSDLLQADVYALGRVYTQICTALSINSIPLLDPCLYIQRFALQLQFGDKTRKVEDTAMRLVQRMKKDWMHWGRRPTGLCGAALLVAARIYDFNRTIKDVVKVVRLSEGTIKKRLTEFEKTDSSKLTIDEFDTKGIDLEQEMDPPCYTEGLRKAKIAQLEEQGQLTTLTEEIQRLGKEIEDAFAKANIKKSRQYKKYTSSDGVASICSEAPSLSDLSRELAQWDDLLCDGKQTNDDLGGLEIEVICHTKLENSNKTAGDGEDKIDMDLVKQLGSIFMPPPSSQTNQYSLRPTAASLGLKDTIEDCLKDPEDSADLLPEGGELDLTDINDEEIDKLILTEEEVKIKTTIWMRENADYLREMKEKEERKAKEQEELPQSKRTKNVKKRKMKTEARSAGEAFEKMVQEKKLSRKINYDVFKDLNLSAFKADESQRVDGIEPKDKKLKVEDAPKMASVASTMKSNIAELVSVENEEDADDYEELDDAVGGDELVEEPYSYHEPDDDYNDDVYEKY